MKHFAKWIATIVAFQAFCAGISWAVWSFVQWKLVSIPPFGWTEVRVWFMVTMIAAFISTIADDLQSK